MNVTRATPASGDVEMEFDPNVNGTVNAIAVQPDGRIVLGGNFSNVAGIPRNNIARLKADGTLDTSFDPNATNPFGNGTVYSVVVQPDGKLLIAGGFRNIGGIERKYFARLNANGTLDAAFNPNVEASFVYRMALQADGRIVIAGGIFSVGGIARNYVARINANGTLDATFNPNAGYTVYGVAVQPDGKVILGGEFTSVGGVTRNRLARLNVNGTLDSAFNPNVGDFVDGVAVQPDGKILIGGAVGSVGGVARGGIARLNANGTLDTAFNPNANSNVNTIALQADGRIVLGGSFTTIGAIARPRVARVNANGTLDATFNPDANNTVHALAVQANAAVLSGGEFTSVGGIARNHLARFFNDAAIQNLAAPSASRVEWLRGGAAPEVEPVSFELTTDGGTNWTLLGAGTRIAGGWERPGLSLPVNGAIRARGRTHSGSSGLMQEILVFGPSAPEIVVEQPEGSALADGIGSVAFGSVPQGGSSARTFTVRNTGNADLTGIGITIDGANAAEFAVTAAPAAPVPGPGGSTTFTVTFTPASSGLKNAELYLAHNDADENPLRIALTATGLTHLEAWRFTYFGSSANAGDGGDENDFDLDGLANLLEFATFRDPTTASSAIGVFAREFLPPAPPQPARERLKLRYQRSKAALADGLIFRTEWTGDLLWFWNNFGEEVEFLGGDGDVEEVEASFVVPVNEPVEGQRFMHLRVIRP